MKRPRFRLLTKMILMTGGLTILTLSASLIVSSMITLSNRKAEFTEQCSTVARNIKSLYISNLDKTNEILDIVIEQYDSIRETYDSMTKEALDAYQENLRITLFGPDDGKGFGMTIANGNRKSYYFGLLTNMQQICSSYEVPSASFVAFDTVSQRLIDITNSSLDNAQNTSQIGLVGDEPMQQELDFFNASAANSEDDTNIFTFKNCVYSDVIVDMDNNATQYIFFVRGEYSLAKFNNESRNVLLRELAITIVSAVFLVVVFSILTKLFLVNNVHHLIHSTDKFVGMMKKDQPLQVIESNVKTTDEIHDLSDSISLMQRQIITYVQSIKEAKQIEDAFNAEVNVASKIQLESLPSPTHFNRHIELRAFIKPAKGVGGDFYDYFYIDDDHLAFLVADVSGKGIPASLFMMRSKESIQSCARTEKDLAKVLYKVNNTLCVNNIEGYFVTLFLGVLDLKTNQLNYISAGHERPFIKHNGECRRLECESNFVLGLEEDFPYQQQSIQLVEGDTILLYTDGLNEAINNQKEEFGYNRIHDSLIKDEEPSDSIRTLIKDLESFEGNEEQFDDITLVALHLKKNVVSYFYLNPTYAEIDDITMKVEAYLDYMDPIVLSKIGVVIDEVVNNIISYGKTRANKTMMVCIEKLDDGARLIFIDNSHPFNPLNKKMRTVQENMEEGIVGGLGISIVKSITEESDYYYSNDKNVLVLRF